MRYRSRKLASPLYEFVEELYRIDGVLPVREPTLLLWPAVHLVFNVGPPVRAVRQGRATTVLTGGREWLIGPDDGPLALSAPEGLSVFGVRFRLGAVPLLSGQPLSGLYRRIVPAVNRLCVPIRGLGERLVAIEEREGMEGAFACLEQHLSRHVRSAPDGLQVVRRAIGLLHLEFGSKSIEELARDVGMSHNHLTREFQRYLGLPPKRLARFYRVARVFEAIAEGVPAGGWNWSDVAQAAGFYDQSHLTREFAAFTGYAPSEFAAASCIRRVVLPGPAQPPSAPVLVPQSASW